MLQYCEMFGTAVAFVGTSKQSRKYPVRMQLAERHLLGDGIEIGAKQKPLLGNVTNT